ncbi:MAG: aminomethyl-transferring glycine dehydrogenase subunit GcvPA [Acidobacteria bacterium]|nr:aminomethyl-transferring glycine dehydrogenase subunit GcvPA [Acidobacteriota bacterium]
MRYLPKSDAERRQMLDSIGVRNVEELFRSIPEQFRLKKPLNLPGPLSEAEIIQFFKARAAENSVGYTSFLGAGVYDHIRSVVPDVLIQRGEFLTSYTPYQPEISQGHLQAIFEFQTLMCQLTGQEVSNASMYDGSTALPEAAMMAERLTGRHRVLVARSVHPEYRQVLNTYAKNSGMEVQELAFNSTGQLDVDALRAALNDQTAALAVQSPNFFGVIEPVAQIADIVHASGALLVVTVTEGVSLGIVRPPAEADIVAMEAQAFGIAPSYGGPFAGVISTREKFVRQLPGRLAGETVDNKGRRGFVLTLATREQHIRREKATSNICTNEALMALAATVYLSLVGKNGLKQVAELCYHKAHYAASEIAKLPGYAPAFDAPFFKEFAVRCPKPVAEVNAALLKQNIIGGYDLSRRYPELANTMLLCVTELHTKEDIDALVAALKAGG